MSDHRLPPTAAQPAHGHSGPLPLVVGVTGHRDLRPEDVPVLEETVRGILGGIERKYPHSRLLLLSPLAEGADRLVARVARDLGLRLFVPLPLPRELYEVDFQTDESRSEFRQLMASADGWFELPLVKGSTPDGIRDPGEQRNRQYAQVGAFIARHSQMFLALWDGVTGQGDDKVGGTGEVVRFRLEGVPMRYDPTTSPLSFASNGPVHHIVTPRADKPRPEGALTCRVLVPPGRPTNVLDHLHDWMDQFNQDALDLIEHQPAARRASKAQLLDVPDRDLDAHDATLTAEARATLEQYAVADSLAIHFQAKTRSATRQLFGWVFVAAMFFNLYHSLPHAHVAEDATLVERVVGVPWLLVMFLSASLFATLWVHRRVEEAGFQNKYQDYRALAEALRIQFFWRVAGISDMVVDHYLRKQRGALEWIRHALYAWDVETLAASAASGAGPTPDARLAMVGERWVTEQRNYYTSRAKREQATLEKEEHRIELLVRFSVGLAFVLALLLTAPLVLHSASLEALKHVVEDPWVHGVIMLSIVALAVTAGLRHGYNQHMARSEHAKQFSRMSELFHSAQQHLAALLEAHEYERATELLRDLGEEALEENGDWVLLHRERPLEVPHSG